MSVLVIEPTITAQWLGVVKEAETASHQVLHEDLESYLVFLLARFTEKPELANSVLAMEYLQAHDSPIRQSIKLQEVGDKCLLIAGLFPERAERKRVNVSYFVELGQGAYSAVGDLSKVELAGLYYALCQGFVKLMDILHVARELAGHTLSPLQAESLWSNARSAHALEVLRKHTKGTLVLNNTTSQVKN